MPRIMLLVLLPMLLLAGCGWTTENSHGDHQKLVKTRTATKVVWGKVAFDANNTVVASVRIGNQNPASLGSDGRFIFENISSSGKVIAELAMGNGRQLLYADFSQPTPLAKIITTTRNNWEGVTDVTITVEGVGVPVHVTPLTDIVSRQIATMQAVNDYLNSFFSTAGIDYVANPEPSAVETAAAMARFPP